MIPSWALGMSLLATVISAVTFIAYPGSGYAGNWSMLVPGIMILAVLAIVGSVVISFYRQVVGMSAYEYFGNRFGYPARAYSSLPTRTSVVSSRRTIVASTFSRGSPRRRRSASTRARMRGSARAKASMRVYLLSSRVSRQRGW